MKFPIEFTGMYILFEHRCHSINSFRFFFSLNFFFFFLCFVNRERAYVLVCVCFQLCLSVAFCFMAAHERTRKIDFGICVFVYTFEHFTCIVQLLYHIHMPHGQYCERIEKEGWQQRNQSESGQICWRPRHGDSWYMSSSCLFTHVGNSVTIHSCRESANYSMRWKRMPVPWMC